MKRWVLNRQGWFAVSSILLSSDVLDTTPTRRPSKHQLGVRSYPTIEVVNQPPRAGIDELSLSFTVRNEVGRMTQGETTPRKADSGFCRIPSDRGTMHKLFSLQAITATQCTRLGSSRSRTYGFAAQWPMHCVRHFKGSSEKKQPQGTNVTAGPGTPTR
jgi:hypothetical protein